MNAKHDPDTEFIAFQKRNVRQSATALSSRLDSVRAHQERLAAAKRESNAKETGSTAPNRFGIPLASRPAGWAAAKPGRHEALLSQQGSSEHKLPPSQLDDEFTRLAASVSARLAAAQEDSRRMQKRAKRKAQRRQQAAADSKAAAAAQRNAHRTSGSGRVSPRTQMMHEAKAASPPAIASTHSSRSHQQHTREHMPEQQEQQWQRTPSPVTPLDETLPSDVPFSPAPNMRQHAPAQQQKPEHARFDDSPHIQPVSAPTTPRAGREHSVPHYNLAVQASAAPRAVQPPPVPGAGASYPPPPGLSTPIRSPPQSRTGSSAGEPALRVRTNTHGPITAGSTEAQLTDTRRELAHAQAELEVAKTRASKAEHDAAQAHEMAQRHVRSAQEAQAAAEHDAMSANARAAQADNETVHLRVASARLEERAAAAEKERKRAEQRADTATAAAASATDTSNAMWEARVRELQARLDRTDREWGVRLDAAKAQAASAAHAHGAQAAAERAVEVDRLRQELQDTRNDTSLRDQVGKLQAKLAAAQATKAAALEAAEQRTADANSNERDARSRSAALESELKTAQGDLAQLHELQDSLTEDRNASDRARAESEVALHSARAEIASLKTRLATSNQRRSGMGEQLSKAQADLQRVRAELSELQADKDEAELSTSALQSNNTKLAMQVAALSPQKRRGGELSVGQRSVGYHGEGSSMLSPMSSGGTVRLHTAPPPQPPNLPSYAAVAAGNSTPSQPPSGGADLEGSAFMLNTPVMDDTALDLSGIGSRVNDVESTAKLVACGVAELQSLVAQLQAGTSNGTASARSPSLSSESEGDQVETASPRASSPHRHTATALRRSASASSAALSAPGGVYDEDDEVSEEERAGARSAPPLSAKRRQELLSQVHTAAASSQALQTAVHELRCELEKKHAMGASRKPLLQTPTPQQRTMDHSEQGSDDAMQVIRDLTSRELQLNERVADLENELQAARAAEEDRLHLQAAGAEATGATSEALRFEIARLVRERDTARDAKDDAAVAARTAQKALETVQEQVQASQTRVCELKVNVSEQQKRAVALEKERDDAVQQIAILKRERADGVADTVPRSRLTAEQSRGHELEAAVAQLTARVDRSQIETSEAHESASALRTALAEAEGDRDVARAALEKAKARAAEASDEFDVAQAELKEARSAQSESTSEAADSSSKAAGLQARVDSLQRQLVDARQDAEDAQAATSKAMQDSTSSRAGMAEQIATLNSQVISLTGEKGDLDRQVLVAKQQATADQDTIDTLTGKNEKLRAELAESEEQVVRLEAQVQSLQRQLDAAKETTDAAAAAESEVVSDLRVKLSAAREDAAAGEERVAELEEQVSRGAAAADTARTALAADVAAAKADADAAGSRADDLESDLADAKAEVGDLQAQVQSLQRQLDAAKETTDAAAAAESEVVSDLRVKLSAAREDAAAGEERVAELEEQVSRGAAAAAAADTAHDLEVQRLEAALAAAQGNSRTTAQANSETDEGAVSDVSLDRRGVLGALKQAITPSARASSASRSSSAAGKRAQPSHRAQSAPRRGGADAAGSDTPPELGLGAVRGGSPGGKRPESPAVHGWNRHSDSDGGEGGLDLAAKGGMKSAPSKPVSDEEWDSWDEGSPVQKRGGAPSSGAVLGGTPGPRRSPRPGRAGASSHSSDHRPMSRKSSGRKSSRSALSESLGEGDSWFDDESDDDNKASSAAPSLSQASLGSARSSKCRTVTSTSAGGAGAAQEEGQLSDASETGAAHRTSSRWEDRPNGPTVALDWGSPQGVSALAPSPYADSRTRRSGAVDAHDGNSDSFLEDSPSDAGQTRGVAAWGRGGGDPPTVQTKPPRAPGQAAGSSTRTFTPQHSEGKTQELDPRHSEGGVDDLDLSILQSAVTSARSRSRSRSHSFATARDDHGATSDGGHSHASLQRRDLAMGGVRPSKMLSPGREDEVEEVQLEVVHSQEEESELMGLTPSTARSVSRGRSPSAKNAHGHTASSTSGRGASFGREDMPPPRARSPAAAWGAQAPTPAWGKPASAHMQQGWAAPAPSPTSMFGASPEPTVAAPRRRDVHGAPHSSGPAHQHGARRDSVDSIEIIEDDIDASADFTSPGVSRGGGAGRMNAHQQKRNLSDDEPTPVSETGEGGAGTQGGLTPGFSSSTGFTSHQPATPALAGRDPSTVALTPAQHGGRLSPQGGAGLRRYPTSRTEAEGGPALARAVGVVDVSTAQTPVDDDDMERLAYENRVANAAVAKAAGRTLQIKHLHVLPRDECAARVNDLPQAHFEAFFAHADIPPHVAVLAGSVCLLFGKPASWAECCELMCDLHVRAQMVNVGSARAPVPAVTEKTISKLWKTNAVAHCLAAGVWSHGDTPVASALAEWVVAVVQDARAARKGKGSTPSGAGPLSESEDDRSPGVRGATPQRGRSTSAARPPLPTSARRNSSAAGGGTDMESAESDDGEESPLPAAAGAGGSSRSGRPPLDTSRMPGTPAAGTPARSITPRAATPVGQGTKAAAPPSSARPGKVKKTQRQEVETFRTHMKNGLEVHKYAAGRKLFSKAPDARVLIVRATQAGERLFWVKDTQVSSRAVRESESSMKVSEINGVGLGKDASPVLRSKASSADEDRVLSIAGGDRTLDLRVADHRTAVWLSKGIKLLVADHKGEIEDDP